MQIIAGIYKHRTIKEPRNNYTHPMGSREKLALFNMLTDYLQGATVLDAFAGTGTLGLEALSRGATEVVFVEKSPQNARLIADNLNALGEDAKTHATIIAKPVEQASLDKQFDIIIADPPYDNFDLNTVAALVPYLKPTGIFILSHPALPTPPTLPNLNLLSTHHYAAAHISCFSPQSMV